MKKILIIAFAVILSNCSESKKTLTLAVANREINYVNKNFSNHNYSYSTEQEKKRSETIITYVFANQTKKKQLLIFDKESILPSSNSVTRSAGLSFFLKNKEGEVVDFIQPILDFSENDCLTDYILDDIKRLDERYETMGISSENTDNFDNYIKNSIIIYPGETRTFKVILNLPLIYGTNIKMRNSPMCYENIKDSDNFILFYSCEAKIFERTLPTYILNELKNNNVEIFDGKLMSDPVKLKS